MELEVDFDNEAALAFYQRCGFELTERTRGTRYAVDWWRGRIIQEVDKLVMVRHDGGGTAVDGQTCAGGGAEGDGSA